MLGDLEVGIDIAAPPRTVWEYVTDWERQSEWIPLTTVRTEGSTVIARTALGPLGFDDPMEVAAWEPPHRCELVHTGRVVRGTGAFTCAAAGTGTRFVWSEHVAVPGGPAAPVLWLAARPALQLGFAHALRRLRDRLESGAGPAPVS